MVAVEEAEGEPWDVEEPEADEEAASAGTRAIRGGAIEMLRGAEGGRRNPVYQRLDTEFYQCTVKFCEILILELIHKFSNKL